jgi:hypothetical protein
MVTQLQVHTPQNFLNLVTQNVKNLLNLATLFFRDWSQVTVEHGLSLFHRQRLFSVHASLLFANMAVGLLYLFAGGDMGQTFGLALVSQISFFLFFWGGGGGQ